MRISPEAQWVNLRGCKTGQSAATHPVEAESEELGQAETASCAAPPPEMVPH